MPTPQEQALTSLLPTLHTLPPELLSLSTSLLAQSRTKASTLKPEEEIARTYACCHIACQRLGHKLALEIGRPAPPVKPKVYEKVHRYFNAVLVTTSTGLTPKRVRGEGELLEGAGGEGSGKGKGKATPTKGTPTKGTSGRGKIDMSPAARVAGGYALGRPGAAHYGHDIPIPEFAKPIIHHICRFCRAHDAIPHVFAGVESALPLLNYHQPTDTDRPPAKKRKRTSKRNTSEGIDDYSIAALVIGIFLAVHNRLHPDVDHEAQLEAALYQYERFQARGQPRPRDFHDDRSDGEDERDDSYDNGNVAEEAELYYNQAKDEWSEMEWYQNIPTPESATAAANAKEDEVEEEDEDDVVQSRRPSKTPLRRKEKHASRDDDDDYVGAAGLMPGLGTMFQPSIDWLSEERREEYGVWKRSILREAGKAA